MFNLTKEDLQKSQKCPPGMHIATLTEVEEPYISPKSGCDVQKVVFETSKGYSVPNWFNSTVLGPLFEFIEAADNIKFDVDNMKEISVDLKKYIGKKVCISVSHRKEDGKVYAQVDSFFSADKVPF